MVSVLNSMVVVVEYFRHNNDKLKRWCDLEVDLRCIGSMIFKMSFFRHSFLHLIKVNAIVILIIKKEGR